MAHTSQEETASDHPGIGLLSIEPQSRSLGIIYESVSFAYIHTLVFEDGRGHDVRKSQFSATVIFGKNSAIYIIKITSRGSLLHKLGRRETVHAGNWHERKFQFKYKIQGVCIINAELTK